MRIWRLAKKQYASSMNGEGAKLYGGRWNSMGKAVIYTATSLSLAVLEQLVRIDPDEIPDDFVQVEMEIPDTLQIDRVLLNEFPENWEKTSSQAWFQKRGNNWLEKQESVAMMVPSVIVPQEENVLLNPAHDAIKQIRIINIDSFCFDSRLFKV
jgi:RES domain-containing protein